MTDAPTTFADWYDPVALASMSPTAMAEAAWAAATERAARVALAEKVDAEDTGDPEDFAYNQACDDIAAAIRRPT